MNKVNRLLSQHGNDIRESLGSRNSDTLELVQDEQAPSRFARRRKAKGACMLDIDQIIAVEQHRQVFEEDSLQSLADSMASTGQIQPVVVRYDNDRGKYVLIAGERRFRAAKLAGFTQLRCDVKDEELTEQAIAEIQLAENCAREDLNPMERARAFCDMMEAFGCSANQLSKKVGVNQTTITRHLSLLKLPPEVQKKVISGELSMSAAAKVSTVEDQGQQERLIGQIVNDGMNRDQAVEQVNATLGRTVDHHGRSRSSYTTDKQFRLRQGARVRVMSHVLLSEGEIIEELKELVMRLEDERA